MFCMTFEWLLRIWKVFCLLLLTMVLSSWIFCQKDNDLYKSIDFCSVWIYLCWKRLFKRCLVLKPTMKLPLNSWKHWLVESFLELRWVWSGLVWSIFFHVIMPFCKMKSWSFPMVSFSGCLFRSNKKYKETISSFERCVNWRQINHSVVLADCSTKKCYCLRRTRSRTFETGWQTLWSGISKSNFKFISTNHHLSKSKCMLMSWMSRE